MQQDRGLPVPYLRETRLRKGLTQRNLAKLASGGKSPGSYVTISRAENGGNALPSTIRRWAKALGVRPETLTGPSSRN